jgi:hypothetical protein
MAPVAGGNGDGDEGFTLLHAPPTGVQAGARWSDGLLAAGARWAETGQGTGSSWQCSYGPGLRLSVPGSPSDTTRDRGQAGAEENKNRLPRESRRVADEACSEKPSCRSLSIPTSAPIARHRTPTRPLGTARRRAARSTCPGGCRWHHTCFNLFLFPW